MKDKPLMERHNEAVERMKTMTFRNDEFQKSGDSAVFNPICVEVARRDGVVAVRDSKNPSITPLMFSNPEWEAFVGGVKKGQFDV